MVLYKSCKYGEALKEFRAASLAAPKSAFALTNVGMTQSNLGMYKEASEIFQRCIALRPYPPTFFALAQLLRGTGRLAEAIQLRGGRFNSIHPKISFGWNLAIVTAQPAATAKKWWRLI